MRQSISALKSWRRQRLSVDVLEDRQLLATITVNTAGDTTSGVALSLRQAIEVSDGTLPVSSLSTQEQAQVSGAVGATNTIDFNIPTTDPGYDATTGVWTIAVHSALPTISKTRRSSMATASRAQREHAGPGRQREAQDRLERSGPGADQRAHDHTSRVAGLRARHREFRQRRLPGPADGRNRDHGCGQRPDRGLLHRHRPDGRDRRRPTGTAWRSRTRPT